MKKPPIKNFTTEIPAMRSAGEISGFLAGRGARAVSIEYDNFSQPEALQFSIILNEQPFGYRMPCRAEGVLKALKRGASPRYQTLAHARNVAWRVVRDWVLAQFALIDAGAADVGEVFLPYILVAHQTTLWQRMLKEPDAMKRLALPAPGAEKAAG